MHPCRKFAIVAVIALSFFASNAPLFAGTAASRAPLITQAVDERNLVTLPGNTRPEAKAANDRGPVADDLPLAHMYLLLKRSSGRQQAAEDWIDRIHDQNAPEYHQWFTADQIADRFGPVDEDIHAVGNWLTAHGFTVNAVYRADGVVDFSGSAGAVREAFHTEIHRLDVNGKSHIANLSDPKIPAALAPAVEGVVSLHDFRPHSTAVMKAQYTDPSSSGATSQVVPADIATIYNFGPLLSSGLTGKGETIAVIEDSDVYNPGDWQTFRSTLGLNAYKGASFETLHPGKGCTDPGVNPNFDYYEAIIDAEWATAEAPSANIWLASCADTNTTSGILIALQNLVNQRNVPPVINVSYAECEALLGAAGNAAYRAVYQQAVMEGVSIFVASGDNGAAVCDQYSNGPVQLGVAVNGMASTAYDVAVGGTDFGDTYAGTTSSYWSATNGPAYGSALSYVPEIAWNDTCASTLIAVYQGYTGVDGGFCATASGSELVLSAAGSGGPSNCATGVNDLSGSDGTCRGWTKPAWQLVSGNPKDGVRDLPDVSLFAADGVWNHDFVVCATNPSTGQGCTGAPVNWGQGGGTSYGTPIMAGLQALIDQKLGSPQGNPNYVYYALAAQQYSRASETAACDATLGNQVSPQCVFHDVTLGDNDVDCAAETVGTTIVGTFNCYIPSGTVGVLSLSNSQYEPAYPATNGWDFATGLGSVNAYNLAQSWPRQESHTVRGTEGWLAVDAVAGSIH